MQQRPLDEGREIHGDVGDGQQPGDPDAHHGHLQAVAVDADGAVLDEAFFRLHSGGLQVNPAENGHDNGRGDGVTHVQDSFPARWLYHTTRRGINQRKNRPPCRNGQDGRKKRNQTMPWAFMASATFRKPAMLAPTT